ncbi:MAG: DegV family protein [Christensenellales bacterium]|jgi:DegV family protein with EDD domain
MNFIISSDSCLDEFKEITHKEQIHVIPMTVITEEETFKDDFSSLEQYDNFYKEIGEGKIFKTASLNSFELEEHFTNLLKQDKDIIHFSLSSGLSVTYNVTKEVAERLNQNNNRKIYVVDTLSATQGQNLLVKYAIKLRDENVFPHEAYNKLVEVVKHLDVAFFVTDFDCLKRGGRVSGAQAVVGKLVGIRPVLDFDTVGKLRVVSKVIGNKKALAALCSRLENYDEEMGLPFFITHTGNFDVAQELTAMVKEKYPNAPILEKYIGPTIGSHTGQGALGLVFLGKGERK